jgi:hypothetical protein
MQIARYPSICVRANRPPRCSGFTINHIGGIMCPPSPAALEIPLSPILNRSVACFQIPQLSVACRAWSFVACPL